MQLIFGDLWDLDKLQTCAKGKCILKFRSVSKENPKNTKKKLQQSKKVPKKWFDRAALWRVYVNLISSTSMQKENPVANSVRQIKIRCAKYKFAARSHNFLVKLSMQLIFGDLYDLDQLQTCAKRKSILEFRSVSKEIQKMQKIETKQKSTKKWFHRAALGENMLIWLVRHPCERIIQ